MEEDESHDPSPVGLFGTRTEVADLNGSRDPISEVGAESRWGFAWGSDGAGFFNRGTVARHGALVAGVVRGRRLNSRSRRCTGRELAGASGGRFTRCRQVRTGMWPRPQIPPLITGGAESPEGEILRVPQGRPAPFPARLRCRLDPAKASEGVKAIRLRSDHERSPCIHIEPRVGALKRRSAQNASHPQPGFRRRWRPAHRSHPSGPRTGVSPFAAR